LEHSPDGAPLLVATPRHLRKRRMHTEIPDTLLVPGAPPVPLKGPAQQDAADRDSADKDAADGYPAGPDARDQDTAAPDAADLESADLQTAIQIKELQQIDREMVHRRKRRVALLAVLFVAICLPALVLALLFV
jgi:hypothetical protein